MNEIRLCNRNQRDKRSRWHDTDTDNGEVITSNEKPDQVVSTVMGIIHFSEVIISWRLSRRCEWLDHFAISSLLLSQNRVPFDPRQSNEYSNAANRLEEKVDACFFFFADHLSSACDNAYEALSSRLFDDRLTLCWVIVIAFRTAHHFRIGDKQRPLLVMMPADDLLLRSIRFESRDWWTGVWSDSRQRLFYIQKGICANDYRNTYDLVSVLIRYDSLVTFPFLPCRSKWPVESDTFRAAKKTIIEGSW